MRQHIAPGEWRELIGRLHIGQCAREGGQLAGGRQRGGIARGLEDIALVDQVGVVRREGNIPDTHEGHHGRLQRRGRRAYTTKEIVNVHTHSRGRPRSTK